DCTIAMRDLRSAPFPRTMWRHHEGRGSGTTASLMPGALGCETARPRAIEARGLVLHALESGRPGRPGVLLLHGGAAHAHWWDAIAPALADRYPLVALDQRGHGESGWPSPPAYATEDFVADLVGVMDAIGWDRAAVVGHSMGGHNAIAFTAWHADRV